LWLNFAIAPKESVDHRGTLRHTEGTVFLGWVVVRRFVQQLPKAAFGASIINC